MLTLPTVKVPFTPIDWRGLPRRFIKPNELETLVLLLNGLHATKVAEFGCNEGRTSYLIMQNVPTLVHYIGVDVPPNYQPACAVQRGDMTTAPGRYANADARFTLMLREKGTCDLSATDFGTCDAVFIDGDHSRPVVEYDTALARQIVRSGGLVIWHDYHDLGTVDVRDVLHEQRDAGHDIRHVEGTWLAYEVMP
ncbi:class I SAM-dependent methyltransferase [Bradyrhizobium valentinum]|uniref:class I SAM-dependent methyltransferase n=1 Tax=Bradyrhizobium valentinum TaxID=1518501 RepID=UPI000710BF8C|nr:class I SAM-dependent methyltransferase [Bradyrhizobium valentinum]KRR13844.1 hypothetical protein CQ10_38525 [Bradyrhizobium valentinum]